MIGAVDDFAVPAVPDEPAPVTVLCVVEGPATAVPETLAAAEGVTVRTDGSAVLPSVDLTDVDGVVGPAVSAGGDAVDVRAAVREQRPALPLVLVGNGEEDEPDLPPDRWTATLPTDLVTRRSVVLAWIRRLVDHAHAAATARRTLAALETATNGIAVVAPDGTYAFVNRGYARRFDAAREDLVGRPWRTGFTDETVDRIESAALPTAADGWRWTGECHVRQDDGGTMEVPTGVVGLADGSLVFTLGDGPAAAAD